MVSADYNYKSPRDRWLRLNPGKTPEDWAILVKAGLRKKELFELDGRVYVTDEERKRRQRERQRLCRKRRKERQEAERAATEAELAALREQVEVLELYKAGCDICRDEANAENAKLRTVNAKLVELFEWAMNPYRLGAVTGEGVDKRWCRETYDGGMYRLRQLGVGA